MSTNMESLAIYELFVARRDDTACRDRLRKLSNAKSSTELCGLVNCAASRQITVAGRAEISLLRFN